MVKLLFSYIGLVFLVGACSGMEQSQHEKIRQVNAQKELIYRNQEESHYPIAAPTHRVREGYPWEPSYRGTESKITKEQFRCKGSSGHAPRSKENAPGELVHDCEGVQKHSLFVHEGKEFIYPALIDLLNYVQAKTGCKVIVTCGYRCPAHNTYADGTVFNQSSKHMIGAEVDFYVRGMENKPEEIAQLIMNYYKEHPPYQGDKDYEKFQRLEKSLTNVATPPWYNKEVLIKLYQKNEGRDFDNKHSHPYLCLQMRHDREKNEKVVYSWEKAFNGYLRY